MLFYCRNKVIENGSANGVLSHISKRELTRTLFPVFSTPIVGSNVFNINRRTGAVIPQPGKVRHLAIQALKEPTVIVKNINN